MQFSPDSRKITLSIGEFATFHSPSPTFQSSTWDPTRMAAGTAWQKKTNDDTSKNHPNARFEVPICAKYIHKNWTFELTGRIDEILPHKGALTFREIKTLSTTLPQDPADLQALYPHYFTQLATYCALAPLTPDFLDKEISGELLFVNINDGSRQTISLTDNSPFLNQLDLILPFLEERAHVIQELPTVTFTPPFQKWRPEQSFTLEQLEKNPLSTSKILFEAPTGFGKTGTVLHFALNELKNRTFSRILYLTSKSTGQGAVLQGLASMIPADSPLRYFQLRNKTEHQITSPLHTCTGADCVKSAHEQWQNAPINIPAQFSDNTLPHPRILKLGEETGICPYEISRKALPYSDIWVCDYNYLFHPSCNGVLKSAWNFDPAQTLVILDEAHNLATRVRGCFSYEISHHNAQIALEDLCQHPPSSTFLALWQAWTLFLHNLTPQNPLPDPLIDELEDLLEKLQLILNATPLDLDLYCETTVNQLFSIKHYYQFLTHKYHKKLIWCETPRTLQLDCLDASYEIAETLKPFPLTCLMSATLSPMPIFLENCGFSQSDCKVVRSQSPWRDNAYDVAIDMRVDTRLKTRKDHYTTTAETINTASLFTEGPIAVFFPSYAYANAIQTYIEALNPMARVAIQPRGVPLPEQNLFIQESLLFADALFLILGSSFSESIDALGGAVELAIIVGPALPQITPVQEAYKETFGHLSKSDAFHQAYQIPAIQKINQALGRIVRAPGQKARVLLHCKRFKETAYQNLLAPEYQSKQAIRHNAQLLEWLEANNTIALADEARL